MVLLLFNIPADRFGIHIVVGHCLVPLAVVHIGKTVRSLVNFAGLGIVNALVAEGGVALLLAHNVLTSVAAFPGGHKAVHGRIEVLADLLSKGNLFIACLIGGTDKAVGILQGFEAIGQHTFPLDTHILLENVPGLAPTSLLLLEQLRTIDRKRLRGYIGRISKEKMLEVDAALAISIGIGYPNERRTHNV